MKLIVAIIQPHKLEDIFRELDEKEVHLKTVSNALGCGRQKGRTEVYRGKKEIPETRFGRTKKWNKNHLRRRRW